MAKTFKLEIVTPEKLVFSADVESLVVPAERGYLGILAGHAPLLCALKPGEIKIRQDGRETYFATSGGFMEATPKKTTILSESAESITGIDLARAEKSRQRAKERLNKAEKSLDRGRAQAALERAENRIKLTRKHGRE